MRIGIIGAMKEELSPLYEKIKNCHDFSFSTLRGCQFFIGTLNNAKVVLLQSGIGKSAATFGTTLLIERYKPDVIINIGSAGSLVPILKIGDIVISNETRYHDVDVTAFGYKYGQIPGYPIGFKSNDKLIHLAEKCVGELHIKAACGLIVSGDTFINNTVLLKKILYNFPEAIAVEMEATAVAQVCYNFNIPFVVVRSISDTANQDSHLIFRKFLTVSDKKSIPLIEMLMKKLSQISFI